VSTLGLILCSAILLGLAVVSWLLSSRFGPVGFVTSHLGTYVAWWLMLSVTVWTDNGTGYEGGETIFAHMVFMALLNLLLAPISFTGLMCNAVR